MRYPWQFNSLVSIFLFEAVAMYNTASADPCVDYQELNQADRSAAAEADSGSNLLCDNTLSAGWYRFISYVGGEIPTTCVEPYHCGTQVPIWMDGTLPTDSTVVNRTVCTNYGVPGDCCTSSWNIQVKRCVDTQGVFYVYDLVPTFSCAQAYCAGTLPLCPDGEVYHQSNDRCMETRHPAPCNFEAIGTCEWRQSTTDDIDWTEKTAGSPGTPNLPSVDSTLGISGGHFLSVGNDALHALMDLARLISPVIVPSVSKSCNMMLHYHLWPSDSGSVDVLTRLYNTGIERTAWHLNKTTDEWKETTVTFREQEAFEVIIQGLVGGGEDAPLGIDDISFSWDCVREVDGSVRLVDGARFDEGRVEIYYNHRWGTICNIGWTRTSADVVCAQLGYRASVWTDTRYPAPDSTPILLDDVTCDSRNKSRITECRTKPWENWSPLCNHDRDVSVRCVGDWHRCRHDAFVCSNEACLPGSAQCDFTDNCGDGSDESDCGSFPERCDFQDGLCNWVQQKDDGADWIRGTAGSVTEIPSTDHNGQTDGDFLYILGTSQINALLKLPVYFASSGSNCSLLFYYFMNLNNASLTVRLNNKVIWNQNESQGTTWQRQIVPLEEDALFQVSFEGHIHEASSGSIAIDDVTLTPECIVVEPESPSGGLSSGTIIAITVTATVVILGVIIASVLTVYCKTAKYQRKPSPDTKA